MGADRGYNMVEGGRGALGFKHTPEERARRSDRAKASWKDPEFRAKCTASGAATLTSPSVRAKLVAQKRTPEGKARQSAAMKEVHSRPEVRAKVDAAHRAWLDANRWQVAAHLEQVRRRWTDATHCPRGHEFTEENTRHGAGRIRECRRCIADAATRRRRANPEKSIANGKAWRDRHPDRVKAGNAKQYAKRREGTKPA